MYSFACVACLRGQMLCRVSSATYIRFPLPVGENLSLRAQGFKKRAAYSLNIF